MDLDQFWSLIESARTGERPLYTALASLPAEMLPAFEHRYESLFNLAATCEVEGAAYLIQGGGDDSFLDF